MRNSERHWRQAIFPTLLVAFARAYVWRLSGVFPVEPVTGHLSNFYLTGAAVTLLAGPQAFVDPSRRRRALVLAALFAGVNVVGGAPSGCPPGRR